MNFLLAYIYLYQKVFASCFGLLDAQGFIHGLKAMVFSRILDIINKSRLLMNVETTCRTVSSITTRSHSRHDLSNVGGRRVFSHGSHQYAIIGCLPHGQNFMANSEGYAVGGDTYSAHELEQHLSDSGAALDLGSRVVGRLVDKKGNYVSPRRNEPEVVALLPILEMSV